MTQSSKKALIAIGVLVVAAVLAFVIYDSVSNSKKAKEQEAQIEQETERAKMQLEDSLNQRDNETKILVAQIAASVKVKENDTDGIQEPMSEEAREKLREQVRQFDAKLSLDRDRLNFDKEKARTDAELKRRQINKKPIK